RSGIIFILLCLRNYKFSTLDIKRATGGEISRNGQCVRAPNPNKPEKWKGNRGRTQKNRTKYKRHDNSVAYFPNPRVYGGVAVYCHCPCPEDNWQEQKDIACKALGIPIFDEYAKACREKKWKPTAVSFGYRVETLTICRYLEAKG